jgi:hypothetical protein
MIIFKNKFLRILTNILIYIGIFAITMINPLLGSILMLFFAFLFGSSKSKLFLVFTLIYCLFVSFYTFTLGLLFLIPCLIILIYVICPHLRLEWTKEEILHTLLMVVSALVAITCIVFFVTYIREYIDTEGIEQRQKLVYGSVNYFFDKSYYLYIAIPFAIYILTAIILRSTKIVTTSVKVIKRSTFFAILRISLFAMVILPILYFIIINSKTILAVVVVGGLLFGMPIMGIFDKDKKTKDKKISVANDEIYAGNIKKSDIIDMINAGTKLKMDEYDWKKLAEIIYETRNTNEIKVKYINKLPVYIFPQNKKPYSKSHWFEDSKVSTGGELGALSLSERKEYFSVDKVKNGEVCVIYDGKRLTHL